MDIRIDGVNVFNPLEGKLDDIVDCMVEFYGEKHRDIIEERIHNSEFFFVPVNGFDCITSDIQDYFVHKKEMLIRNMFAKLTSDESRVDLIINTSVNALRRLKTHQVNLLNAPTINNILLFLKVLKTPDDKLLERGITKNNLNYDQFKRHTTSESMSLKDLIKFMEDHPENWQLIDNFINDVEHLLIQTEDELAHLKQEESIALQKSAEYDKSVTSISEKHAEILSTFAHNQLSKVVGEEIEYMSPSQISSLRETYFKLLHFAQDFNFLSINFLSKSTKTEFINFFNKIGYHLGDNFKDYLNLVFTLSIFSKQTIAEFETINKQIINEKTANNPIFQECITKVDQLDLSTGSMSFARSLYQFMNCSENVGAYVLPTITSQEHQLKNLVVCPWAINASDHANIHELGHVVESVLLSVDKTSFTASSGFDKMIVSRKRAQYTGENLDSNTETSLKTRPYMLLNEIINEYFSIEVMKIMHKRGVQINLGKRTAKNDSLYTNAFLLLKDFIEEYKDLLIDCRMSGDPYSFARIIGEDNFEMLAQCCRIYLDHAKTPAKMLEFKILVERAKHETGLPFQEILHNYPWPENVKELIEQHKKVSQIMDNIKASNISVAD